MNVHVLQNVFEAGFIDPVIKSLESGCPVFKCVHEFECPVTARLLQI